MQKRAPSSSRPKSREVQVRQGTSLVSPCVRATMANRQISFFPSVFAHLDRNIASTAARLVWVNSSPYLTSSADREHPNDPTYDFRTLYAP